MSGGDGTPPPGYPPGGYPPQGPVPVRTGSGAMVIALVAVAVVVLLGVGAVVVLVVAGGDGDDPDRATARGAESTAEPGTSEAIGGGSGTTADPGATDAPAQTAPIEPLPTDPVPTDPVPTDSLPTGGTDLSLPDGLPVPAGATEGAAGFLEVPGLDAGQVRDFYVAELPAAGYTVDDVTDLGDSIVMAVSGPDSGSLVIVGIGTLPTTVGWSAT